VIQVYVIQTGQTTWQAESRVESPAGSPLTEEGILAAQDTARELARHPIKGVYACTSGEAERQTTELVSPILHAKVHDREALHELDFGLWQGLTVEEIKRRQPRAYRQWTKSPGSTRPPEGETLAEAHARLRGALKEITRRHKDGTALVVLRPVVAALLKCLAEDSGLDDLWEKMDDGFRWACYNVDQESL